MKTKKTSFISIPLIFFMLCTILGGCNTHSEDEIALLKQISQECTTTPMTYSNLSINYSISNLEYSQITETWRDYDNAIQYANSNLYLKTGNNSVNEDMLLYIQQEGTRHSIYGYSQLTNKWVYEEEVYDTVQQATSNFWGRSLFPSLSQIENATLDWNIALTNAKRTYIVNYTMTSSQLLSLMEDAQKQFASNEGMNLNSLHNYSYPITFYIDMETHLPVRIEISIAENSKRSFFDKLFGKDDVNLPPFSMVIKDISYKKQDVPIVPPEIRETYGPKETSPSENPDADNNSSFSTEEEAVTDPVIIIGEEVDEAQTRPKFKRKK